MPDAKSGLPPTNVVPMPQAANLQKPWWSATGVRRQVTASVRAGAGTKAQRNRR